jgi:hypothetical protein
LNDWVYKIGLRLAQLGFVRKAIDDRANLEPFKKRPTFRILLGVFLIGFSFLICWPAISALGGIAIYLKSPWIIAIGGPVLYVLSHLCHIAGMGLSGAEYSLIFLRWFVRVAVERMLQCGLSQKSPES